MRKMVIVLDVHNENQVDVYETNSIGETDNTTFTFSGRKVERQDEDQHMKVKRCGANEYTDKRITKIQDHTVIRTHSSPGCVTYWFGGYPYTVCT
jgi:hypothetical protein